MRFACPITLRNWCFFEMLKTPDSGQFSFFTVHLKMTRGGHYHQHQAREVLGGEGTARFRFHQILTDET